MVAKILFPEAATNPEDGATSRTVSAEVTSSNTDKQNELALALYNKGRKSWAKGQKDEALGLFRKAVAIQESSLGSKHPQTAQSYYFLGYALSKHNKEYVKALVAYRRTLRSRLWTNGSDDVSTEDAQRAIRELLINRMEKTETDVEEYFAQAAKSVQYEKEAKNLAEQQEYDKAVEAYEQCLSIEKDALGKFPLDIGRLYMKIGSIQRKHKEYEMGLNAYRNALMVLAPTLGKDHADSKRCLEGIESCARSKDISEGLVQQYLRKIFVSLDHCQKADTYLETGDDLKAVEELEAARTIEEAALGQYPLTVVGIRKKLASIFESREDYDRAIYELRMVLSINIFDCGGDHPSVIDTVKDIGAVLKAKGLGVEVINRYTNTVSFSVKHQRYGEHLLTDEEDFSAAIEEFQKSLALEAALGKYHLTQGTLFKNIGDAFLAKKNFDFAVVNYRNALLVYLPKLGKDHIETNLALVMIGSAAAESVGLDDAEVDRYRENVSESIILEKMGDTLAIKGDKEEAIESYEKAVALEESSLVEYHLSTADLHGKIATVLKNAGQYDRAIVRYRNILSIYLRALGADHPNTQNAHDQLVKAVSLQGLGDDKAKGYGLKVLVSIEHEARGDEDIACQRNSQGMGEFRKALEIEENSLGETHLVTAALYGKLADGYRLNGRSSEAIQEYRRAIKIYVKHESPQHDATKLLRGLGKCIQDLGFNETKGAQYREVVWESVKLELNGDAAVNNGDHTTALYHYSRSISLEESVLGKLHPSTSLTYKKIADIYRDNDDFESAIVYYSKVLAIRESHLGKDDAKTVESYNDLMNATQKQAASAKSDVDGWIMMQYVLAALIGLLVLIGTITKLLSNKKKYSRRLNLSSIDIEDYRKESQGKTQVDPPKTNATASKQINLFANPPIFEAFKVERKEAKAPAFRDEVVDARVGQTQPDATEPCPPEEDEEVTQLPFPKEEAVVTQPPPNEDKEEDAEVTQLPIPKEEAVVTQPPPNEDKEEGDPPSPPPQPTQVENLSEPAWKKTAASSSDPSAPKPERSEQTVPASTPTLSLAERKRAFQKSLWKGT